MTKCHFRGLRQDTNVFLQLSRDIETRNFMIILVEHHKAMTSVREDTHANLLLRYSHMT